MFCRKICYSKIEKIHYKNLKVIYDIDDSYSNLLLRSYYVSEYQRNLQWLVTEIFQAYFKHKSIFQINPEFMWSLFNQKKLSYSVRKWTILNVPRAQSTYCGTNAVNFRDSFVRNNLLAEIKSSNSVFKFKTKVKIWKILILDILFAGKLVLVVWKWEVGLANTET